MNAVLVSIRNIKKHFFLNHQSQIYYQLCAFYMSGFHGLKTAVYHLHFNYFLSLCFQLLLFNCLCKTVVQILIVLLCLISVGNNLTVK